jgi:hypothetical protein
MREIVRRAISGRRELTAELLRRDMFGPEEKAELLQSVPKQSYGLPGLPLGPVQFATLLSRGDTQLSASVVLRGLLRPNELTWLDRLLRFRKPSKKRNELCRIVERALEGRKENVRR